MARLAPLLPLLAACSLINPKADFAEEGDDLGVDPVDMGSPPDLGDTDLGGPRDLGSDPDEGVPDMGPIIDPSARQQIALSWVHTCAIADGEVYCWGGNGNGQIGDGTTMRRTSPTLVDVPGEAIEVSAMGYQSCALNADGEIYCWGLNNAGQLGDGTRTERRTPVRAQPSIDDAVRVSVGGENVCAVRENGDVMCWGRGSGGGLGNGGNTESLTPVQVTDADGSLDIDGSGGHFCTRTADDSAACWGWNGYGQLGQPFSSPGDIVFSPVSPPGISGIDEVSAGGRHTCARTASVVACWGWNSFEQLGTPGADTENPVVVPGLPSLPVAIAAGGSHTCAAMDGGDEVFCWGGNGFGQLGLGDTDPHSGPERVSGFTSTVVELDAGDYHTCARLDTGVLACWGLNNEGQLGTGTTDDSLTPRVVVVGP